jgi:penicillin-binding protein-related factor A (putative recombinase)
LASAQGYLAQTTQSEILSFYVLIFKKTEETSYLITLKVKGITFSDADQMSHIPAGLSAQDKFLGVRQRHGYNVQLPC